MDRAPGTVCSTGTCVNAERAIAIAIGGESDSAKKKWPRSLAAISSCHAPLVSEFATRGGNAYGTKVAGAGTVNGVTVPFAWLCDEPPALNALKPAAAPGNVISNAVVEPIALKF